MNENSKFSKRDFYEQISNEIDGGFRWFARAIWTSLVLGQTAIDPEANQIEELMNSKSLREVHEDHFLAFDIAMHTLVNIRNAKNKMASFLEAEQEDLKQGQVAFDMNDAGKLIEKFFDRFLAFPTPESTVFSSIGNNADLTEGESRQFVVMDSSRESIVGIMNIIAHRHWLQLCTRVSNLSPSLISSVKIISFEYMRWMKSHADAIDTVAWEAFEQLVAEIMASHGFNVDLTGRLRNKSADIIAIRSDELGVETKYLIECKRYEKDRRVGIDVVNQVIGSARRADADHAILVTSSEFTRDVVKQEAKLRDKRLHLRDGQAVAEWLREYKPREDIGLWLPEGWDMDQDK